MAQVDRIEHLGAAQIEIAPLHAGGLVGFDAVFDGERGRHARVEHVDGAGEHFDFAGSHVGVHGLGPAVAHRARDLEHVFAAQVLGFRKIIGAHAIGVDDHLRVARTIAQVDEDQPAVVAVVPRPAGQHDLAAHILSSQLAARCGVHAVLVHKVRHLFLLLSVAIGIRHADAPATANVTQT